ISARASSTSRAASDSSAVAATKRIRWSRRSPAISCILLLCRESWERIRSDAMANLSEAWDPVFAALERLRTAWPSRDWMYDRRLKCVASSIPLAREADARAAMAEVLPVSFSVDTLATASAGQRDLVEKCGGLRANQLLFWGGGDDAPGVFGLWWPWG